MCRKGIRINIPEPYIGYDYGNVSEHGDVSRCPRKSSLFFLTILMSLAENSGKLGEFVERDTGSDLANTGPGATRPAWDKAQGRSRRRRGNPKPTGRDLDPNPGAWIGLSV